MPSSMDSLLHFLFILIAVAAVANASATANPSDGGGGDDDDFGVDTLSRRFLPERSRVLATVTCDKSPLLCLAKNSPGPICCNRTCTKITIDQLNCGTCGLKCPVFEICCNGHCVNSLFDKNNCNGCNKTCKKGGYCIFGMCDYA